MPETPSHLERLFTEASSDSSTAPSSRRNHARPRKRRLRNTMIVLGSLILLLCVATGIAYALVANSFNDIERIDIAADPALTRPAPAEVVAGEQAPINVLLLGSDSRETTDPSAAAEDLKGFRSDTIMVAQISGDRKHVGVMSIMRDNWVTIQGHGDAKINAAVAYGGIPLAVNTVENFIDARIDHVALIDFDSFSGLTDALGGVTVNNSQAFTSRHGDFTFEEGPITLNGEEALGFVRERYAFADGDYQRARNQQEYLKGLLKQLLSAETLSSVDRVTGTFNAIKPYLILDRGLDLPTSVGLGFSLRDLRSGDIDFFTSPTLGTGTSADGQSIVIPDQESMTAVREAFRAGTVYQYAEAQAAGAEVPQ